jgi:hypothetical protein
MTHAEFVAAYAAGSIRVRVDRKRAAQHVSRRLMLPLVLLPFFGIAVALALTGRIVPGAALFLLVIAFRFVVRSGSQGFVLWRAMQDAAFYREALDSGLIALEPVA